MNQGPLQGNHKGWLIRIIPSFPTEHQHLIVPATRTQSCSILLKQLCPNCPGSRSSGCRCTMALPKAPSARPYASLEKRITLFDWSPRIPKMLRLLRLMHKSALHLLMLHLHLVSKFIGDSMRMRCTSKRLFHVVAFYTSVLEGSQAKQTPSFD